MEVTMSKPDKSVISFPSYGNIPLQFSAIGKSSLKIINIGLGIKIIVAIGQAWYTPTGICYIQ
jgi:hypothetical protein